MWCRTRSMISFSKPSTMTSLVPAYLVGQFSWATLAGRRCQRKRLKSWWHRRMSRLSRGTIWWSTPKKVLQRPTHSSRTCISPTRLMRRGGRQRWPCGSKTPREIWFCSKIRLLRTCRWRIVERVLRRINTIRDLITKVSLKKCLLRSVIHLLGKVVWVPPTLAPQVTSSTKPWIIYRKQIQKCSY